MNSVKKDMAQYKHIEHLLIYIVVDIAIILDEDFHNPKCGILSFLQWPNRLMSQRYTLLLTGDALYAHEAKI